jgi:hypothetical protein
MALFYKTLQICDFFYFDEQAVKFLVQNNLGPKLTSSAYTHKNLVDFSIC